MFGPQKLTDAVDLLCGMIDSGGFRSCRSVRNAALLIQPRSPSDSGEGGWLNQCGVVVFLPPMRRPIYSSVVVLRFDCLKSFVGIRLSDGHTPVLRPDCLQRYSEPSISDQSTSSISG